MNLLFKNANNTHFLNQNSSKNLKSLNGPKYTYINIIHYKKIDPIIPFTTLVLKYICNFSNFVIGIILSLIYSIHSSFSLFVGFKK
jgi:hypothetical protein